MKQVVLRRGELLVAEVPAPSPQPGHVLVANVASVISSGTERAAVSDGGGSLPMRAVRNPDLVLLTLRHAREHGLRETVELVRNSTSEDTTLGYACAGIVLDTGGLGDFFVGQAVACAAAGHARQLAVRHAVERVRDRGAQPPKRPHGGECEHHRRLRDRLAGELALFHARAPKLAEGANRNPGRWARVGARRLPASYPLRRPLAEPPLPRQSHPR